MTIVEALFIALCGFAAVAALVAMLLYYLSRPKR